MTGRLEGVAFIFPTGRRSHEPVQAILRDCPSALSKPDLLAFLPTQKQNGPKNPRSRTPNRRSKTLWRTRNQPTTRSCELATEIANRLHDPGNQAAPWCQISRMLEVIMPSCRQALTVLYGKTKRIPLDKSPCSKCRAPISAAKVGTSFAGASTTIGSRLSAAY